VISQSNIAQKRTALLYGAALLTRLIDPAINCKRPAEQRLYWERKDKRIPGQSITSSIVKSLSEASFGLIAKAK